MNEEINIAELLNKDIQGTISLLMNGCKSFNDIVEYREEYKGLKRNIRQTQLDFTQKDKKVADKRIPQSRIPIPFQKKIVNTATAFEVGEAVTLKENETNALTDEIKRLWRVERIDSKVIDLVRIKKSETQSALLFYMIKNIETDGSQSNDIKTTILESKDGIMRAYFDERKDMVAFVWKYTVVKITDNGEKTVNHTVIYDKTTVYYISDESGTLEVVNVISHGFNKIPVVYLDQDEPEWFDVKYMIDRYETSLSKLADSNDYMGHPFLLLYGEMKNELQKGDPGKTLRFDITTDSNGNKQIHGDAKFLEHSGNSESIKLELDKLEKHISYLSGTPQLAMEDLKGIGALSGVAIKLMFLDAIIKAKLNEGQNRSMIERIINVFISGTVTTTNVGMKQFAKDSYFEITFNSILPDDISETVSYVSNAVTAGVMSKETGVKTIGIAEDTENELKLIESDKDISSTEPPANIE